MDTLTNCMTCGQEFWTRVKKNKKTGKMEFKNDKCQTCRNRIVHRANVIRRDMVGQGRVAEIPKTFEKELRMRELVAAEMKRRREAPPVTIKETGQEEVLDKAREQREKLVKELNKSKPTVTTKSSVIKELDKTKPKPVLLTTPFNTIKSEDEKKKVNKQ